MEAIRIKKIIENDGEIILKELPYKKGENIEMILYSDPSFKLNRPILSAKQLLDSGVIGIWKNRKDIKDSAFFARKLREKAQIRNVQK